MLKTKLNDLLLEEEIQCEEVKQIINQNEIVSMLANHQHEERKINSEWKKFLFEWESVEGENLELSEGPPIYRWLYPIKFNIDLAIIIEAIQRNMNYILVNRVKGFEMIYCALKIDKESFYTKIEEIQNILIEYGKVKVCNNGTVILMNEDCERYFSRRGRNAEKEIYI